MGCGGYIGAGSGSAVLHGYLETPTGSSSRTARSQHRRGIPSDRNGSKFGYDSCVLRVLCNLIGFVWKSLRARTQACHKRATSFLGSGSPVPSPQHQEHSHQQRKRRRRGTTGAATSAESCGCLKWWSTSVVTCLPAVCAGVMAVMCYLNSLDGEFVHDDMVAVVGNPDVTGEHRPRTQDSSLWMNDFWGRPMADIESHKSYRPLTVLSFRANFVCGGRQVRGYHAVNVALHCACSALVAIVARSVLKMTSLPAWLAAALFATHPVHTEAVSSIVGRAEVLCCFFFLLSLLCYHRICVSCATTGESAAGWLAACGLLAACSLLAKEQGITVLPLCVALRVRTMFPPSTRFGEQCCRDHSRGERRFPCRHCILDTARKAARDRDVLTLMGVLALLLSFRLGMLQGSLPQFSAADNPASFSPKFSTRLLTYSYICAFNAWLMLCPRTLSYDWQMGSIPLVHTPLDPRSMAVVILVATLAALGWQALSTPSHNSIRHESCACNDGLGHHCGPFVPLLLTTLPFLPASNLFVPVGFVIAERVLYIPSIGVCLIVAQGFSRIQAKSNLSRWGSLAVCSAMVLLFAARTWDRNRVWVSREALFESGIRDLPGNAKMHYNYGNLQKDLGNTELAIKHYRLAIELCPEHASAHNNLGTVLTSTEEAERHFRLALSINPNHPGAHFNLANVYSKQGQKELARILLERAVELEPEFSEAYSSLAALAAGLGHITEAERLHRLALRSDAANADARNNYGTFLQTQGRIQEAVDQYQRALELHPNHTVALLNAARSLRTMNLDRQAECLYKKALAVEPDPQVMDNLAGFYINAGRLDDARVLYDEALKLFPDHVDCKVHQAQLLMRLRNFSGAEYILLEVIDRNNSHKEALHTAALLYNLTNRTAEAIEHILKALKLCAIDDRSCAKIHADHGDILKDIDDLNSSAESYMMAIRLDPDLAHAHLNLAVIRHLEGDYWGAFHHYQAALSLDPKNELIVDNMAKLRRRLARRQPSHRGVALLSSRRNTSPPASVGVDGAIHVY
ncbi:protein O-mannosyl-transferase TMTC1-like [Amblyomma americanum]